MKKLFTLVGAFVASTALFAQVTVTYQVDITGHLADGNTVGASGIRIAGGFGDLGVTSIDSWSPADDNSQMENIGGNIYSISVTYPESSVGSTQYYKFVNGNDWGNNEGDATLADCGEDDGFGGFNRTLVIPAEDATVAVVWNGCDAFPGASIENNNTIALDVYPNPAFDVLNIRAELNGADAVVRIMDLSGRVVLTQKISGDFGTINVSEFVAGTYIYEVVSGNSTATGRFIKK